MFLHLGNGVSVRTKKILAIQDYAVFQNGPGRELLKRKYQDGLVINTLEFGQNVDGEGIKSLILTEDKIYLSAISPLTLKRRSELALSKAELSEISEKLTESGKTMIME